jgi:hypothetical protein
MKLNLSLGQDFFVACPINHKNDGINMVKIMLPEFGSLSTDIPNGKKISVISNLLDV